MVKNFALGTLLDPLTVPTMHGAGCPLAPPRYRGIAVSLGDFEA